MPLAILLKTMPAVNRSLPATEPPAGKTTLLFVVAFPLQIRAFNKGRHYEPTANALGLFVTGRTHMG
jgi:hypothetical protein